MNTKGIIIIIATVLVLVLISVFVVQGYRNTAIDLEETISKSYSDMNAQLKRRADLIPNLVECVKAYDKHEYETLLAVIEARGGNYESGDVSEITAQINIVAEAYPELKSNTNYENLMIELTMTENKIVGYRESYNNAVRNYNTYCRKFPQNVFLRQTNYEQIDVEYLEFNVSEDAPVVSFE